MEIEALPAVVTAFLTVISPYVTALFTNFEMSSKTKNLIALGFSAVVAVVYVLLSGGFAEVTTITDLAAPLGIVYAVQQLAYNLFLKGSVKKVEATKGVTKPDPKGLTPDDMHNSPTVG